uniref:Heat shock protein binding protein n=1 Tax=Arundo donax TaxID=35708 RepID=A0A0A9DXE6_ARUDO
MALELLQAHRDESLHHQFNMRGRRTSSTERPSSTWRSMSQPSDPVKDASRKAKQKAADIQHELEEFRAAEQDAALGTARPHDLVAHGAKKSGASQEGVKTNKGKILVS